MGLVLWLVCFVALFRRVILPPSLCYELGTGFKQGFESKSAKASWPYILFKKCKLGIYHALLYK